MTFEAVLESLRGVAKGSTHSHTGLWVSDQLRQRIAAGDLTPGTKLSEEAPLLTRRNVIIRGAELAPLLGHEFVLESGGDTVRLKAGRPAHPCAWMDSMLAPGAHKAMRGRGGVRCRVVSDGVLHRGPAVLVSPVPLDPARAGEASVLRPSRLP